MLQRKQTLFLLLSIVLTVIYLFTPVIILDSVIPLAQKAYEIKQYYGGYFVYVIIIVACKSIGVNLLAIFLYKYPTVQKLLTLLSIAAMLFAFGFVYYRWSSVEFVFDSVFYYGNILPFVIIILNLLAIRSIAQDEEIVKSYDRLR